MKIYGPQKIHIEVQYWGTHLDLEQFLELMAYMELK